MNGEGDDDARPHEEVRQRSWKNGKGTSTSSVAMDDVEKSLWKRLEDTLEHEPRWKDSTWYKHEIMSVKGDVEGYAAVLEDSRTYDSLRRAATGACWRAGVRTFSPRTGEKHPSSP